MRRIKTRILGIGAAVMLSATLAGAQAPDTNRTTIVTFSAPVSLPGVTLPAGSYLFKLADSQVNRNIVQVFDKDRSKIYATILAIPAQRNEPADETVITFRESPANAAPAIQYWYYPGETMGQEFAYPKKQAMEIANATHKSVLSIDTDDTSADAMAKGQISRVEPGADTNSTAAAPQSTTPETASATPSQTSSPSAQSQTSPSSTPSPSATAAPAQTSSTDQSSAASTAQRSQGNQNNTTPSMSSSSNTQGAVGTSGSTSPRSGRSSLPKTASTLPLIGLAGLLALGSAFGIGALRRAYA